MPEWLKVILRPIYFRILHWRGNPGIEIHSLRITDIVHEYGDVFSFVLKGDDKPDFIAGQYAHVIPPKAIRDHNHVRHMSFANAPHEDQTIISMNVSSGSHFKRKFASASRGDRVNLFKVRGTFCLDPAGDIGGLAQPVLFIAGGIGITPIRALISDLEYRGKHNWSLIYAGRGYLYRDFWAQFRDQVALTRRETLFDELGKAVSRAPQGAPIYLCGSDDFISNVQVWLLRNGVLADQIHVENFDH